MSDEKLSLKRVESPEFPEGIVYQFQREDGTWVARVVVTKNKSYEGFNLRALEVKPDHRRQRLARTLLERVLRAYEKFPVYLRVSPFSDEPMDTAALTSFYESVGFRLIGRDHMMRGAARG